MAAPESSLSLSAPVKMEPTEPFSLSAHIKIQPVEHSATMVVAATQCNIYVEFEGKKKSRSTQCNITVPKRHKSTQHIPACKSVGHQTEANISLDCNSKVSTTEHETQCDIPVFPELKFHKSVYCNIQPLKCHTSVQCVLNSQTSVHTQCNLELERKFTHGITEPCITEQLIFGNGRLPTKLPKQDHQITVLQKVYNLIEMKPEYKDLTLDLREDCDGISFVKVTNRKLFGLLGGNLEPIELIVSENGNCTIAILFKELVEVDILTKKKLDHSKFEPVLEKLTNYKLCPGIGSQVLVSDLNIKVLENLEVPFSRKQSQQCPVLYLNDSAKETDKSKSRLQQCLHCRNLKNYINKAKRRKMQETPTTKLKRLQLDSNYSLSNLSPEGREIRYNRLKKAHDHMKVKLSKLEKYIKARDLSLSETLSQDVAVITEKCS